MRRVGGIIPERHALALEQAAQENGRTFAAELRLAIQDWLRKHGRITT
jgi:hypothetical protein